MKVLFQLASSLPSDWVEIDSSEWDTIPQNVAINALCIQGDIWEGPDLYGVHDLPNGGLEVVGICNDPNDWPVGQRYARQIRYGPLREDPRPEYGRAYNSVKDITIYADNQDTFAVFKGNPSVRVLPYNPGIATGVSTRKGQWVSDEHFDDLVASRYMPDWRTWTEGVPTDVIKNGRVIDQAPAGRKVKPKGTQTRILSSSPASSISAHTALLDYRLARSITSETTISDSTIIDHEVFFFAATSLVANDAAWTNTGTYRCQLDASSVSADLSFGLLNVGSSTGHFCRLGPRGDTCHQGIQQDQSAFSSAGLHLASITNPSWSSGAVTDTMGCLIAGYRTAGHTKQTLTLRVNRFDDYMDGPWKTLPSPLICAHVMGY